LHLTKVWKIRIIGSILAMSGLSLWGVNVFLELWSNIGSRENALATFIFAIIFGVGMVILYYSNYVKKRERKNLGNK
jgi:flagellar biosynthesis regulator FlaF